MWQIGAIKAGAIIATSITAHPVAIRTGEFIARNI
jgi:hypothetical protein